MRGEAGGSLCARHGAAVVIERWSGGDGVVDDLAQLLHACVHAGASVSFVVPFSLDDAAAFWRDRVIPVAREGKCCLLLARDADRVIGTVQLDLATPPNQPHRAEVRKLLVHPEARRRGIARVLMKSIEEEARGLGRTLLTLDTVTGGAAEGLYRSIGYERVGVIPKYARNSTGEKLESTTVMYKELLPGWPE